MVINEKVSEGNRYELTPSLRAYFCSEFQLTKLDGVLGVVCTRGFTKERIRRKAEIKWRVDSETGIEEPYLEVGELEQREEQDAIFLLPLTRYDYKSGSGLRHVRLSLEQLKRCQEEESRKADLTVVYSEDVCKRAGVKKRKEKEVGVTADELLIALGIA